MDADQVGLHLLAGFLSCFPVGLLGIQLVAASLEALPAHVTLIFLIIGPRVCGGTNNAGRPSCINDLPWKRANSSSLTSREGVQGSVGPFLTHIRQSNRTVPVLPAARRLGPDHSTVMLIGMVRLA